jgi:NAD(P)-dependent dehydrogenase (short-subunit alcohol dehydrogenase family)
MQLREGSSIPCSPVPTSGRERGAASMIDSNVLTNNETVGREIKKTLKGKVAFVTGVTGVLGGEVAKEFARRGARLILHYNSHVRKAIELELAMKMIGADVVMVQADYSQPLDMRDLIRTVNAQAERIDFLVHTAGICRRTAPPMPVPEQERSLMNQINQIAPIEITLGLEGIHSHGAVILYIGSSVEDIRWESSVVYGESKKGLHHFAARYADAATRRGVRSIYYLPGVVEDAGSHDVYGTRNKEAMILLGQEAPLHAARVARNIVSSVVNEPIFGVEDSFEGNMLVRRDGYRI